MDSFISCRLVHPLKELYCITDTLSGIAIDFIPLFSNAEFPILSRLDDNCIYCKLVQSANVPALITLTPSGIIIFSIPLELKT